MSKPLRSADPTPKSVQFAHFGVLNDGSNSKGAFATSFITNIVVALLVVVISAAVKTKVANDNKLKTLTVAVKEKPPEPKPKPPPPKPPPPIKPLPIPPKIEPPKIKMPDPIKPPPEIKPIDVPKPVPVVMKAPAPIKVEAPPAPKVVNLAAKASAASVVNNDAHPSAVRLGTPDSPIKSSMTGPAVSRVNLSAGMPGMPASNSGSGPPSKTVNMGNGQPSGGNLNASGKVNKVGLGSGCSGPACTGTGPSGPKAVAIAPPVAAAAPPPVKTVSSMASPPTVTYKPTPVYTADAKAMHLEGNVSIRIRVSATGAVTVLGVVHGLGHGLDEAAVTATQGTRFKPALDGAGHPMDWEGVVLVSFQMS